MADEETLFKLSRDRHLFGRGHKRILSLDGGGVRGSVTIAFLERIEKLLREYHGKDTRLCDWFDLIGGTSTGAIIAGALALGYRTEDIKDFYLNRSGDVFSRQWSFYGLRARFRVQQLRREIEGVVGDRTLESSDILTGLGILAKRLDTGSPWILANNPRAPFWEDTRKHIGNRHYKLAALVRASTAAPIYFEPEILQIIDPQDPAIMRVAAEADQADPSTTESKDELMPSRLSILDRIRFFRRPPFNSQTHGIFVDGGVSPHGNPSLALFEMTQFSPFGICWPTGSDRLTVVSVGTGSYRPRLSFDKLLFPRNFRLTFHAMMSFLSDAGQLVLAQMQWMGDALTPWILNSEIGALSHDTPPGGKLFRFIRYDVRLEHEWLEGKLGISRSEREVERIRPMDRPASVHELYEIGQAAAEKQVTDEHWKALVSPTTTNEAFARMRSEPL